MNTITEFLGKKLLSRSIFRWFGRMLPGFIWGLIIDAVVSLIWSSLDKRFDLEIKLRKALREALEKENWRKFFSNLSAGIPSLSKRLIDSVMDVLRREKAIDEEDEKSLYRRLKKNLQEKLKEIFRRK